MKTAKTLSKARILFKKKHLERQMSRTVILDEAHLLFPTSVGVLEATSLKIASSKVTIQEPGFLS